MTDVVALDYYEVGQRLVSQLAPVEHFGYLSRRELQILIGIGKGKTPTEIGRDLFISIKTVSTYQTRMLYKFDFERVPQLRRAAVLFNLCMGI